MLTEAKQQRIYKLTETVTDLHHTFTTLLMRVGTRQDKTTLTSHHNAPLPLPLMCKFSNPHSTLA